MSLDADVDERRVFVANLSDSATGIEIGTFVSHVTNRHVVETLLLRDDRGFSRRCAILTFNSRDDAAAALAALPGQRLLGRPVRATWARPVGAEVPPPDERPRERPARPLPDLFIGNLPRSASELDLRLHIEPVARVRHVGLLRRPDGRGSGAGFVRLEDADDVERVISELDGQPFQGRPLRIERARPPAQRRA